MRQLVDVPVSAHTIVVALLAANLIGGPTSHARQPVDSALRRRVLFDSALRARRAVDSLAAQQPTARPAPRLIGLDTTTAIRTLALTRTMRGVRHLVVFPSAALVPIDSIVDQRPLPDSAVRVGDTIRVFLGGRAVVPRLVGLAPEQVPRVLEAARLGGQPGSAPATADSEIGRVVRQAVDSGTLVVPFTSIEYDLGTDARVAMPSVIGRTLADARATLRDGGLTTDPGARNATGEGIPVDSVAIQEPAAGSRVWPSTPIVLTLGLRPVLTGATTTIDTAKPTPIDTGKTKIDTATPPPIGTGDNPPPRFPWLPVAIVAVVVVVLAGATLAARAAWVPTITSHTTLRDYAPRLAVDEPSFVAGGVSLRAHVESHSSRVAARGAPSLIA